MPRARRAVGAVWFWPAVAVAVLFLVRWPLLALPMNSDEGGYAYATQRWLDGEGRLYHDLWISRPQGIFVAYAAILETLGGSVVAIRFGAAVAAAATLVFVWLFARLWAGERVAAVAAVVFAIVSGSPTIEGYTANAEVFMALPVAIGAWLLLRMIGRSPAGSRGWHGHLAAVGACAGAATLLKPSGVVLLPMALAFVWLIAPTGILAAARRAWAIPVGFGLALVPSAIHGALVGWDAFVFASIIYRLEYQSTTTAPWFHQLEQFLVLLLRGLPELGLLLVLLRLRFRGRSWAAGRYRGRARSTIRRQWAGAARLGVVARAGAPGLTMGGRVAPPGRAAAGRLLLGLWLLAAVAGIAMGGDWWYHYAIQLAAPFALWVAVLLVGVWPGLPGWSRPLVVVGTAVALLGPFWPVAYADVDRASNAIVAQPGYPSQDEVAAYVRAKAPREAAIFVAFDHPAIYHLADRPAAYRYLYDQELQAIPGSYAALIAVVSAPDRPYYVVGTKERAPYPDKGRAFWEAVSDHYVLETMVHGVPIYRRAEFPPPPRLR